MSDKYIKKIRQILTPGTVLFGNSIEILVVSIDDDIDWMFSESGLGDEIFVTSYCLVNQTLKRGQFRFRRWGGLDRVNVKDYTKKYVLFDFDELFFRVTTQSNTNAGSIKYYVNNIISIL